MIPCTAGRELPFMDSIAESDWRQYCMAVEVKHEQRNKEDCAYGSRFAWLNRLCR
jgi:hypothetical protein